MLDIPLVDSKLKAGNPVVKVIRLGDLLLKRLSDKLLCLSYRAACSLLGLSANVEDAVEVGRLVEILAAA
jgi:hypothetical protein